MKLIVGEQKISPEPGGKLIWKKSKEEMPFSIDIDMPSNENEKRSTKKNIHKSLAVSSKVVVQNTKYYFKDE